MNNFYDFFKYSYYFFPLYGMHTFITIKKGLDQAVGCINFIQLSRSDNSKFIIHFFISPLKKSKDIMWI